MVDHFFFSSRRRHTSSLRDWSSDVCSSDLHEAYGSIDILVNNAAGNFLCRAEKLSYNGWRTVVDIVLNGNFFCCRAAFPYMQQQKYGRILSILATYASGASPGSIHSAAAKAGVQAM